MRRILLTLATSALLLTACGGNDTTAPPAERDGNNQAAPASTPAAGEHAEHNDADVTFLSQMIPHHEQAVEMAELASTRAERPEVTELADTIISTQNAEIEQMRSLLQAWGEPEPESGGGHGGGHDQMPGMMTPEQMEQMQAASGAEFDQMFIEHMIAHHEGAIEMADTVLTEGASPEVKQLAEDIRTAQQQEIDQMRTWQ